MDNSKAIATKELAYSFHTFLFPFEWQYQNHEGFLFEEQVALSGLERAMDDGPGKWERRESWNPPSTVPQFNEVAYFYDFVRPVLYDIGTGATMQQHYFRSFPPGVLPEYVITLIDRKLYLEIDDVTVSFYDTGVGVVAFHLLNRRQDQSSPDDILLINVMGRRIYPPFLGTDLDRLTQQDFFEYADFNAGLNAVKYYAKELPLGIAITSRESDPIEDRYESWVSNPNLDREPGLIKKLLPDSLFEAIKMRPVLDDRMFVVSWYGNTSLVKDLQKGEPETNFLTHDWWYKYVFVDKHDFKTCPNKHMASKLIEHATNPRWANMGTYYGVSRYSFTVLTGELSTDIYNSVILSHVQTIYQKIALLGLVQRASLIRFSREVTDISELDRSDGTIAKRVSSLYQQYIRFINRYYFREVTAQEQGIELYDILQAEMRLDGQVTALDREIQELHNYVLILDEDNRNERLDLLTYFAALFVVPGFITSYYGIGDFNMHGYWWAVSIMSALSAGLALAIVKSSGTQRWIWIAITILFSAFVVFGFPALVEFKS